MADAVKDLHKLSEIGNSNSVQGKGGTSMNLFRRITMGILSGNPQDEPLHYGEVYGLWTFVLTGNKMIANHQMLLNHVGDDDLKKLIGEAIDGAQAEVKQVSEILKANGIALPPAAPEPPKVDLESIPVGARFIDPDVAATASAAVAAGLVSCSTMMGQSIREDVGMMFGQFHTNKAMLGAKFLKLLKEKGWLIPPPLHQNKED
jgi:Protein of unknown function (DUF3231)